jgi:hypothetical protein
LQFRKSIRRPIQFPQADPPYSQWRKRRIFLRWVGGGQTFIFSDSAFEVLLLRLQVADKFQPSRGRQFVAATGVELLKGFPSRVEFWRLKMALPQLNGGL